MVYSVGKELVYPWPCDIREPSEKRVGQFDTYRITVNFKSLPVDEGKEIVSDLDGATDSYAKELMRRVVMGWGAEVQEPFNAESLEVALNNIFVLNAITDGYRKSVSGEGVQARKRKN